MRRVSWLGLIVFCLLVAVFIFLPSKASAATQEITMTPTEAHISLKAGGTYNGTFSVLNQGKNNFKYIVYATPYSVKGENYTPDFTLLPGAPIVTNWIKFSSSGGLLSPGQSSTVNYSLSIPPDTSAGGYYLVAFAQTENPGAVQGVTINESVGLIFYINTPGKVTNKGSLLSFDSTFFQTPPLTSSIRIKDSGGLNFESTINYQISDIFGNQKYVLKGGKELLPKTIRLITIPWPGTPSIGIFKVSGSVSFLNHSYKLGTKYVIVMSKTDRAYFLISFTTLIAVLIIIKTISILKRLKQRKNQPRS